ncbi:MAG: hypothetical protein MJH10_11070 [Epibacterium sp.]|nr:hypothetical protein [Epibacterium sp.]NQX74086.1 hypothetical protein [Epibacterium sp.]
MLSLKSFFQAIGGQPNQGTYITDPMTGVATLNPNSLRAKVIQAYGAENLSSPKVGNEHRAMVHRMEQENLSDSQMQRIFGDQYRMFLKQIGA